MADHRRTFITAFTATIGVAAAGGCLALIGTAPASAQSYRHEFVRPDGSSLSCTTTIRSAYSSSSCTELNHQQRMYVLDGQIEAVRRSNKCAEQIGPTDYSKSFLERYIEWETCMGRKPLPSVVKRWTGVRPGHLPEDVAIPRP